MRKKYDFTSKQIHVKVFPNLRQSQWEVQMLVSREKKSDFTSKQIHMTGFPNLRQLVSHPLTLRAFLDTLWWTSVILFGCRQVSKHMGGLIHQKKVSCNQFSLRWGPSKIPQPLSGGRHSRLSICQTQRKYQQILRRKCCLCCVSCSLMSQKTG